MKRAFLGVVFVGVAVVLLLFGSMRFNRTEWTVGAGGTADAVNAQTSPTIKADTPEPLPAPGQDNRKPVWNVSLTTPPNDPGLDVEPSVLAEIGAEAGVSNEPIAPKYRSVAEEQADRAALSFELLSMRLALYNELVSSGVVGVCTPSANWEVVDEFRVEFGLDTALPTSFLWTTGNGQDCRYPLYEDRHQALVLAFLCSEGPADERRVACELLTKLIRRSR